MKTVNKFIELLRKELGYYEKASNAYLDDKTANAGSNNYTKYARDLAKAGYYQASKQGFDWCDVFYDWVFLQLCGGDAAEAQRRTCQSGPYGAGVDWSASYYKQAGRFYTSNPQPGDQIFFSDYAHTGAVEQVTATQIITIEGNTDNQVLRRYYSINDSRIDGFGRPIFDKEEDNMSKSFDDVKKDAWYADEIEYCKEHGLMNGVGDRKFEPERPMTRAEVATVVSRLHKALKED